jgi:hypothetical protein
MAVLEGLALVEHQVVLEELLGLPIQVQEFALVEVS